MSQRDDTPDCKDCGFFERSNCYFIDKYFHCPGCGQDVPWCFGAADDMEELCDACTYQVRQWRKIAKAANG